MIFKLNEFRKQNPDFASMIVRQIFDNCCMEAGLESDGKKMVKRINSLMEKIMDDNAPKIEWILQWFNVFMILLFIFDFLQLLFFTTFFNF